MIPNRIKFSIAFAWRPRPVEDVWQTIVSILDSSKCLPKEFRLSQIAGHPEEIQSEQYLFLNADGVRKAIIDRKLDGFRVNTGFSARSIDFWLHSYPAEGPQAFLCVRVEAKTKIPPTWNGLIEALLLQWPAIGAWQWNSLYDSWQTCSEVKSVARYFGVIPPGIKTYIAPPLAPTFSANERMNISTNPGRTKTILPGIDFHPSAEMWLGPHFWQYAKCTKEEVLAAGFFIESRDIPQFLYLKSWPQPFTRPDGEQGRIQQKLWKLLFHEDCEWPPGSGGISDEAIYGPPELMP